MRTTHIALFLFFVICLQNANGEITDSERHDYLFLKQKYTEMDTGLKNAIRGSLKHILRILLEASQQMNISSNCIRNGMKLVSGLRELQPWAISFPDATGKIGDGFMSGSNQMLGNYDQCLRSTAKKKNGDIDFRGKYCLITYTAHLPSIDNIPKIDDRLRVIEEASQNLSEIVRLYAFKSELSRYQTDKYGMCIPSDCNEHDVTEIINYVGEKILLNLTLQYCQTEDTVPKYTERNTVIICVMSFLGLLAVLGAILEHYALRKNIKYKNPVIKAITCFSITSNFQKIIDTKTTDKSISCLAGIRVLTLFHVTLGHHYLSMVIVYAATNFIDLASSVPQFFFQIVANGFLSVDTFFFLGGFLNCYLRVKNDLTKASIPSALMLIVHRLWRIYPAYAFSILLFLLFVPQGPMSTSVYRTFTEKCTTDWWKNMLFINNFYEQDSMCFPHCWYLACDMQYFLLSLLTIPVLVKNQKAGIFLHLAIIMFGMIYSGIWVGLKNISPTFIMIKFDRQDSLNVANAYTAPYAHIASYFSGILLGYILSKRQNIKLSKKTQIFGWIVAGLLYTSMLFMTQKWNAENEFTPVESALYFVFSRPLFSMSVGWLMFCCITGHGGIINYILSLKLWIPLARLSYMMYLISFPLQLYYLGNIRAPYDLQRMRVVWRYIADITVTCLLALPMVVLAESPFISLEKIIFPRRKNIPQRQVNGNEKELAAYENNIDCDIEKSTNANDI